MAKIFLGSNETFIVGASTAYVFGLTGGTEKVIATAGSIVITDQNVERVDLSGASSSYTFVVTGNVISVKAGDRTVATIGAGANPQTIAFSDGSAALALTGLNMATLGGQTIPTIAGALANIALNAADKSASAMVVTTPTPITSAYTITLSPSIVAEGNAVTFTVTTATTSATPQTLNYLISGTATTPGSIPAANSADFTVLTGTVTLAANATSSTFAVTPVNDNLAEGLEGFKVKLLDSSFNTVATSSSIVINDAPATSNPIVLTGTSADDILVGSLGNDTIYGMGGLHSIDAGAGSDTIMLTNSNVNIDGTIAGGLGIDTLILVAPVNVTDTGFTNISGIEILRLIGSTISLGVNAANAGIKQVIVDGSYIHITSSYPITVVGNTAAIMGYGSTGNLTITGGTGTISGGSGNDFLDASTSILHTNIRGAGGADTLIGGSASDTFIFDQNDSQANISLDEILNYESNKDILYFEPASTITLATVDTSTTIAGSNVQVNNAGLITFDSADNTYGLKVTAIQNDSGLDIPNQVALFTSGSDSYVYYSGVAIGNFDDQIIKLSNVAGTRLNLDAVPNSVTVSASNISSLSLPTFITINPNNLNVAATPFTDTFNIAAGSYDATIMGFGVSDKLVFAVGASKGIINSSATDGNLTITANLNSQHITIHLTGISPALDGLIGDVNSFNAVFGTGSIS